MGGGEPPTKNDFCLPKIFKNNRKNSRSNSLLFINNGLLSSPPLNFFWRKARSALPWTRVAVEKPTAGPGGAKEEGRRGRLWSPWTSLSGSAPIRINIQNLDVGFTWVIPDRSREITHSLLCNLLSGRSPNQSTQV